LRLSEQHLRELGESGLERRLLVEERSTGGGGGLFGPKVMVVEIRLQKACADSQRSFPRLNGIAPQVVAGGAFVQFSTIR
jgi:hypothetical protein